ncbi:hypothetical protein [Cronobacter phage EspYZU12]|nr:hypothetical protein EspYZU15_178 [Cronobacter phage EspYZU15]WAK45584.1 hypothetical protein EspYZU14_180 [Cronobacter phage EspYZU14]WBF78368.1 hypothetical protein [Cronobacter phage EspYZU12]
MKYEITPEDMKGRGLDSARYTLTKRENLQLFSICFIHPDDPDFKSDPVEFWASSWDTAYSELMDNVTTFESFGLSNFSETDRPLECEQVRAWIKHYNTLDHLVFIFGETKEEMIKKALDFNDHCAYVLRKMCEMVDALRKAERFDGGSVYSQSMHHYR